VLLPLIERSLLTPAPMGESALYKLPVEDYFIGFPAELLNTAITKSFKKISTTKGQVQ